MVLSHAQPGVLTSTHFQLFLLLPLDGAQDFLTICESAPGREQKEPLGVRVCGVGVRREGGGGRPGEGSSGWDTRRGRRLAPRGAVTGQLAPGGVHPRPSPRKWAQNFHCFLSISRLGFLLGPVEESSR